MSVILPTLCFGFDIVSSQRNVDVTIVDTIVIKMSAHFKLTFIIMIV